MSSAALQQSICLSIDSALRVHWMWQGFHDNIDKSALELETHACACSSHFHAWLKCPTWGDGLNGSSLHSCSWRLRCCWVALIERLLPGQSPRCPSTDTAGCQLPTQVRTPRWFVPSVTRHSSPLPLLPTIRAMCASPRYPPHGGFWGPPPGGVRPPFGEAGRRRRKRGRRGPSSMAPAHAKIKSVRHIIGACATC